MIKFFRNIRQNLLSKGKTSNYFKYAVGEIILVVIGILIALSINNWNEERKSQLHTKLLLSQVQKELAFNITKANKIIGSYREKDSLVYRILHKEVTRADYKSNPAYSHILLGQEAVEISDNAFLNLINSQDNFTEEQDVIILNLKELYGTNKKRVDITDGITTENVLENHKRLQNEMEWYYDLLMLPETPDEMIEYYLTDPVYLNNIASFGFFNLENHNRYVLIFRNNAIEAYKNLSNLLQLKKDTAIIKDLGNYTHYIGKYAGNSAFTFEIKKQKDKLIFEWQNKTDATITGQANIYPDSKTHFTMNNDFGQFKYDENKNVTGFTVSLGKSKSDYTKINDFK